MNKPFFKRIFGLLTLATLPFTAVADVQVLDEIVAIVDDNIILRSELDARLQQVRANIAQSGQDIPEERIRREVMDMMILENIQMQMAERVGLRISDEQLSAAMARIAAQNNMSLEQFREALNSSGTSYAAAREQIRREMVLQQVQRGNVNQRIQITDQEIANYLESEEGRNRTAPEYHFAHILVALPSDASSAQKAQARQQADKIYSALQGGKQKAIDALLKADNVRATDLGWRKQPDLPSLFADQASLVQDGEVLPPMESASGFHVVRLLESRGHNEVIAQTRARHILLKASAIRSEEETRELAASLRKRAQQGESFHELAKSFSEDIGSAQEGGDLGWTNPGQLVPEFQDAMEATAIGKISEPFKSRYGWHIVKVEDRRMQDVTMDLRRNMARNILHERKFGEELDIWLRKIRDEAYVDIK
ncbi:peptidyl-prolyl cis-trans isomerase SurA [Litorivivens lipolytica]|uniref:Chaperone SurA n=1 Tax=Litorivivens lipolytica TaxID=1524264 RepID=A0A7W4W609_9GAMM|nr:peptidylprolyl isomerase [Litorivivens lipolytica]MBB3048131.1 peptidyl-prolyl cis-trans isomerase SurA [Litorivivens lipolytica]